MSTVDNDIRIVKTVRKSIAVEVLEGDKHINVFLFFVNKLLKEINFPPHFF